MKKGKEEPPMIANKYSAFHGVVVLSAWGFITVIASFLFLGLGYQLDKLLGTTPNFMLGLFFLAVFLCVARLYQEAKKRMKGL